MIDLTYFIKSYRHDEAHACKFKPYNDYFRAIT